MPEENINNTDEGAQATPPASPLPLTPLPPGNPSPPGPSTIPPPPPLPPVPPAPPAPPPQPEPEKDWTAEDTAKDETKVPVRQTDPAYWADAGFFRLVILFAGWVLVLSVGGMLLLAANDKEIPQGIVAAASGLVGLLTGIFAAKTGKT